MYYYELFSSVEYLVYNTVSLHVSFREFQFAYLSNYEIYISAHGSANYSIANNGFINPRSVIRSLTS